MLFRTLPLATESNTNTCDTTVRRMYSRPYLPTNADLRTILTYILAAVQFYVIFDSQAATAELVSQGFPRFQSSYRSLASRATLNEVWHLCHLSHSQIVLPCAYLQLSTITPSNELAIPATPAQVRALHGWWPICPAFRTTSAGRCLIYVYT